MSESPRVLALLYGLIGDTLMRVPALRGLRDQYPDMHLTALCDPVSAPVLAVNSLFDEVLPWPRKGVSLGQRWQNWSQLRQSRFDVALDFYFGSSSARLAWISGAKRRIGPGRGALSKLLLTDALEFPFDPAMHMIDRFGSIVRPLGVESVKPIWEFPIHENVVARMEAKAGEISGNDIVFVVGAGDESKRLAPSTQSELGRRILSDGLGSARRLLLVADRRQPELTRDLEQLDGVLILPPLELDELGAAFSKAGLVFTPDTGPLHIALGCAPRVLTWYQSTDPVIHRATRVGHESLYEEVCQYQPCDTRMKHLCELECTRSISVESLLETARRLLESPAYVPADLPARDPADVIEGHGVVVG